jgi:hypothetical protein
MENVDLFPIFDILSRNTNNSVRIKKKCPSSQPFLSKIILGWMNPFDNKCFVAYLQSVRQAIEDVGHSYHCSSKDYSKEREALEREWVVQLMTNLKASIYTGDNFAFEELCTESFCDDNDQTQLESYFTKLSHLFGEVKRSATCIQRFNPKIISYAEPSTMKVIKCEGCGRINHSTVRCELKNHPDWNHNHSNVPWAETEAGKGHKVHNRANVLVKGLDRNGRKVIYSDISMSSSSSNKKQKY